MPSLRSASRRGRILAPLFLLIVALPLVWIVAADAAPSPGALTVGVGGAAESHATFSGGPITGSVDGSGNAPTIVACPAPACESLPITVKTPAGTPDKSVTLTVQLSFTPATGNQGGTGIDGLDAYLLDSTGAVVGSATTGSSPEVLKAGSLSAGTYTLYVSGENAAFQETYTGAVDAALTPPVAPTPTPAAGGPTTSLTFGPATVVSPTIMGGEPQLSFERPVAAPAQGAGLDPKRGFVDWPVSSRTMVGTLWRTLNGGDTYRQLIDTSCAPRNVPNCQTGGGGDTVNRVNNYDGTLNFGDQESLAQEAFASSTDHGDTFPAARQTPVTSPFVGVDRQWIATVDAPNYKADPSGQTGDLQAIFSYHIPAAGEIVAGVGRDGVVRPGVPVLPMVSQSGNSLTDTQPGSPGANFFYQSYRDGGGFEVGVAPLNSYQDPTAYHAQNVDKDTPTVFPWIALDRKGNLYAVWVSGDGNLYLRTSLITDPKNNPKAGGVPASVWTPKVRVNPTALGSTIFPEIVAGDPGRIAITYDATPDYSGASSTAPDKAKWKAYAAISTDALSSTPTFQLGDVSHHVVHTGSICTNGTTCIASLGDRSLLDMTDVEMQADGRTAVVFTDNNNKYARDETSTGQKGPPFVKVARLDQGPSLLASGPTYDEHAQTQCRPAAGGDATWPNNGMGTNLPALDITGACLTIKNDQLIAVVALSKADAASIAGALSGYNANRGTDLPASRVQWIVRWDQGDHSYYMGAQSDASGKLTGIGGQLDMSNAVTNGNTAVALDYLPQSKYPVGTVALGNVLIMAAPLQEFGLSQGSVTNSTQAFSIVGPDPQGLTGAPESDQLFAAMRAVDASPAFDATLEPIALASTQGVSNVTPGSIKPPVVPRAPSPKPRHPAPSPKPKPAPRGCPSASGSVHGRSVGPFDLGLPRAVARQRDGHFAVGGRVRGLTDFFCLRPIGIRALYAPASLLRGRSPRIRAQMRNAVVMLMSADRRYRLAGVRPGDPLRRLSRRGLLGPYHLSQFTWYVSRSGAVRQAFKTRDGRILEVGLVDGRLGLSARSAAATLRRLGA